MVYVQYNYGYSWPYKSMHAYGTDDAFITYRYAFNLFSGNGLYFNINGDNVEGYSNFLYSLLLLPGFFFGKDNIYLYSVILNFSLLIGIQLLFYKILSHKFTKNHSILAIYLVAASPIIWAHVTTGLGSILSLFAFVFFWDCIISSNTKYYLLKLIIASSLAILSRVDGFLLPLIGCFYLFCKFDKEDKNNKKNIIILFGYVVLFMAGYTLFRYFYYEDIISNTFYAKVSGNLTQRFLSGIVYLLNNLVYNQGMFFYVFSIIFCLVMKILELFKYKKTNISFPLIFVVLWILYLLFIGGDFYHERFLLPILLIGIYYFIKIISLNFSHKEQIIAILFILILNFSLMFSDGRFSYQKKGYDAWINLGIFLHENYTNKVLAIDAAGKVPYYSELYTIDMLGLNNKYIGKMEFKRPKFVAGHNKYNPDYIFANSPDLIAAWIQPNLDLSWGIYKNKYTKSYKLKYLINSSRFDFVNNIYDVEFLSDDAIKKLVANYFDYAVLVKK
tara:strand:- start:4308 stop:5813 length:1506 start_codon:yes stop_codon:yes gene_type:complete